MSAPTETNPATAQNTAGDILSEGMRDAGAVVLIITPQGFRMAKTSADVLQAMTRQKATNPNHTK